MGHSTGCQDVMRYLSTKVTRGVVGGIMQAPVSDREGWNAIPGEEADVMQRGGAEAEKLVKDGEGDQLMGPEIEKVNGGKITAYRLWSLMCKGWVNVAGEWANSVVATMTTSRKTFLTSRMACTRIRCPSRLATWQHLSWLCTPAMSSITTRRRHRTRSEWSVGPRWPSTVSSTESSRVQSTVSSSLKGGSSSARK